MGGYDHCTVLYAIKKVSERYQTYQYYQSEVNLILDVLFESETEKGYIIERIKHPRQYNVESMANLIQYSKTVTA